jgi:CBS domain-containing protein
MSRRAAARLESFGFEEVCVYSPGKQDWLAFGLPVEGTLANAHTAARSARADVPTCSMGQKLADVHRRVQESGWRECVVVSEGRIVLGLLQQGTWEADGERPVEEIMDPAPLTVRPHFTLEEVAEKMQKTNTETGLVTNPNGKLIGLLRKNEIQQSARS